jgi:hypothetical protein
MVTLPARRYKAGRGTMTENARNVLLLCQLDGFANSVKPVEIERFLRARGHSVQLVDTYYLSRASSRRGSVLSKLPALRPRKAALYAVEVALAAFTRRWRTGRRRLSYALLRAECALRARILANGLPLDDFDLVVSETPHDAWTLASSMRARTLYDCPTPWADELYDDGRLTERQHRKLRRLEAELFERVDYLSFHWESYARYALERYGISGHNLVTLNFGCTPAAARAQFRAPPRVIYFGSLAGKAIDLPLLSRLARRYPHIDVYGGPPPDPTLGLNYRGYAQPSILANYQLGLITSSDDELRRHGFSAKHPQYLGYGLPVLVPTWRREMELGGSVPYDEESFSAIVERLSDENEWRRVSDEAYEQARRLDWNETLRPLDELLHELPKR